MHEFTRIKSVDLSKYKEIQGPVGFPDGELVSLDYDEEKAELIMVFNAWNGMCLRFLFESVTYFSYVPDDNILEMYESLEDATVSLSEAEVFTNEYIKLNVSSPKKIFGTKDSGEVFTLVIVMEKYSITTLKPWG